MRLILLGVLILLSMAGMAYSADPVWQRLADGIRETDVRSVAVDPAEPDVLYAGTKNSVYKSTDGGKSWDSVYMISGTWKAVNQIVIHPVRRNMVLAATQNGAHLSRDGGKSWDQIFKGLDVFTGEVLHAAMDTGNPDFFVIATARGIFITQDGGATWNRAPGEVANLLCRWVVFDPADPKTLYAATHKGVYCSTDRGDRWDKIYVLSEEEFPFDEIEAEELFQDDEVLDLFGKVRCVAPDPLKPGHVYIACFNGAFLSTDRGRTWTRLPEGGLSTSDFKMIILPSSNSVRPIYATTRKGAFRFLEKDRLWSELYQGIQNRDFRYLALDGQKPPVLWAALKDGIYRLEGAAPPKKPTEPAAKPPERPAPGAKPADAERKAKLEEVLRSFSDEPDIKAVQKKAMWYAEVQPEKIEEWRKQSRARHWLPTLNVTSNRARGSTIDVKGSSTNPFYVVGPDDESAYVTYSLNWDLSNIIWSTDQTSIDTRSRLTAQLRDDVLDETTKTYFERRRLQVENLLHPSSDINEMVRRDLRIQELTANLDALTGGWFSDEIRRRKTEKNDQ
jgi:photosystem II stability/assembly factor-like uncharacterized protein